jgi:hypothetical protein
MPLVNPVIEQLPLVAFVVTVHVFPVAVPVKSKAATVYELMVAPLVLVPLKVIVAPWLFATAETVVGALAGAAVVKADEADEAIEVPTIFVAVTV